MLFRFVNEGHCGIGTQFDFCWELKEISYSDPITIDAIRQAHARIAKYVFKTPIVPCEKLSARFGFELGFKAENLQHIGAFKARGATNAVLLLSEPAALRGVVTHSSGNHAAALARAAKIRQVPAFIVMPHNSAKTKIESVRSFGIEPHFCEPSAPARAAAAEALQLETGATMVHPYDDTAVIAGQGTTGLEILDQWPNVDVVLAPVGGGGLMSGLLLAIKLQRPEVRVIAVEPEWADDAARSLQSGKIEQPIRYDSVADGLRSSLGNITFPIIQHYLDEIVLVSESEILQATRMLSEMAHLVVEPSGSVSFAGAIKLAKQLRGKQVCAVLSGGNIDFGGCKLGH